MLFSPIPQADGNIKNRLVLLMRELPAYNDFLVCGISSQIQQYLKEYDEIITKDHPDFIESGLLSDSVIRLFFLAVLPQKKILGSIGKISKERLEKLQKRLSDYLIAKNQ